LHPVGAAATSSLTGSATGSTAATFAAATEIDEFSLSTGFCSIFTGSVVATCSTAGAFGSTRAVSALTLAFAGLSAAWHLADREPADLDLAVAALAAAALGA